MCGKAGTLGWEETKEGRGPQGRLEAARLCLDTWAPLPRASSCLPAGPNSFSPGHPHPRGPTALPSESAGSGVTNTGPRRRVEQPDPGQRCSLPPASPSTDLTEQRRELQCLGSTLCWSRPVITLRTPPHLEVSKSLQPQPDTKGVHSHPRPTRAETPKGHPSCLQDPESELPFRSAPLCCPETLARAPAAPTGLALGFLSTLSWKPRGAVPRRPALLPPSAAHQDSKHRGRKGAGPVGRTAAWGRALSHARPRTPPPAPRDAQTRQGRTRSRGVGGSGRAAPAAAVTHALGRSRGRKK